jgi:hypothetical protein
MVRFAETFPDETILRTLCAKLSWSHFRLLVGMDDKLKRDFYAEILATVSQELVHDCGKGTYSALTRMLKFSNVLSTRRLSQR